MAWVATGNQIREGAHVIGRIELLWNTLNVRSVDQGGIVLLRSCTDVPDHRKLTMLWTTLPVLHYHRRDAVVGWETCGVREAAGGAVLGDTYRKSARRPLQSAATARRNCRKRRALKS